MESCPGTGCSVVIGDELRPKCMYCEAVFPDDIGVEAPQHEPKLSRRRKRDAK